MAMRKVGVFGAAGVLVAVLIVAGVMMSGLRLPGLFSHKGTLIVALTDDPVQLEHLNVTVSSLSIQRDGNGEGGWEVLAPPFILGGSSVEVDLMELVDVTRDIATVDVEPGDFTKIRLGVSEAEAKRVGEDWEEVRVPPGTSPPAHIDIIVHFEIEEDDTVLLIIDLTADWIAISEGGNLRPVLKAEATVSVVSTPD